MISRRRAAEFSNHHPAAPTRVDVGLGACNLDRVRAAKAAGREQAAEYATAALRAALQWLRIMAADEQPSLRTDRN